MHVVLIAYTTKPLATSLLHLGEASKTGRIGTPIRLRRSSGFPPSKASMACLNLSGMPCLNLRGELALYALKQTQSAIGLLIIVTPPAKSEVYYVATVTPG
jgi:hypothetical protein